MGKWRDAFQESRPSYWDEKYGLEYTFGPPATDVELADAERRLGLRLPSDLREMLSEFNGVWHTSEHDRENSWGPDMQYLDLPHIAEAVPTHLQTCGDQLPPVEDLRKIVFFCSVNGFADLYGLCVEPVGAFRAGEVVYIDHEIGQLESCFPSLLDFVRKWRR